MIIGAGFKPWGDPSNVRGLAIGPDTFSGPDPQIGTQVILVDGSVRVIQDGINPDVLKALATPAGGEPGGEF